jgi:hypothetical protein
MQFLRKMILSKPPQRQIKHRLPGQTLLWSRYFKDQGQNAENLAPSALSKTLSVTAVGGRSRYRTTPSLGLLWKVSKSQDVMAPRSAFLDRFAQMGAGLTSAATHDHLTSFPLRASRSPGQASPGSEHVIHRMAISGRESCRSGRAVDNTTESSLVRQ